jgi:hypothetical protein
MYSLCSKSLKKRYVCTRNGSVTEHWLWFVIELSVPRRRRMTNLFMLFMLVRFWSSMLPRVSVCFLCVCGAESVLCQFVLYVCDGVALFWSLWTDAGVLYFAPSTFYVCSMRCTYDEEVAAASRRPRNSIIELLRVLYVQSEGQGKCRYWNVKVWTLRCLITKNLV